MTRRYLLESSAVAVAIVLGEIIASWGKTEPDGLMAAVFY
jgi:hypothetical protein